jgi:hypothetical protein
MLFVYSDCYNRRLDLGGGTCLKHFPRRHPGVGTAFLFQTRGGERKMTWIKKDAEVLGFEVEEPNSENDLEQNHYHKDCFAKEEGYSGRIIDHITREILEKHPDQKLLCDRCGEEIN